MCQTLNLSCTFQGGKCHDAQRKSAWKELLPWRPWQVGCEYLSAILRLDADVQLQWLIPSVPALKKGEILTEADFSSSSQPPCPGKQNREISLIKLCVKWLTLGLSKKFLVLNTRQVQWVWTRWTTGWLESKRATGWKAVSKCGQTSSGSTCTLALSPSSTSTTTTGKAPPALFRSVEL